MKNTKKEIDMENNNFLNIHVIISHSPSCLNRDEMNMQKSAMFGGKRRVRYSSQSLKHWIRKSYYFEQNFPGVSTRTRAMAEEIEKTLKEKTKLDGKILREMVIEAIEMLVSKPNERWLNKDRIFTQIMPWSEEEKEKAIKVLEDIAKSKPSAKDRKTAIENALRKNTSNLADIFTKGTDIGLFGRMSTSSFMPSIDGAVSVAHPITTHEVDADVDWFTAVDDLVEKDISDDPDQGAAHMNTQEFSSGVFYRYASVNIKQLQVNLGLIPDMKAEETPEGRKKALEISSHLLHLLATVVPSAKQKSFAAYNPADLVMASFSDIPISAANAFETPVDFEKTGGYLQPSIKAFDDYITRVYTGYGLDDKKAVFSLWNTTLEQKKNTLDNLKKWVCNNGEEKK